MEKHPFQRLRRLPFVKGLALSVVLFLSACGMEPGVPICGEGVPSGGTLAYQGSFGANPNDISGVVRAYLVGGQVVLTLESLRIPSYSSLNLVLRSEMQTLFYQSSVQANDCFQTLRTGKGIQAGDRLRQATLQLGFAPGGTTLATALLNPTLPSGNGWSESTAFGAEDSDLFLNFDPEFGFGPAFREIDQGDHLFR